MITINFDNPAHGALLLFCILFVYLMGLLAAGIDVPDPLRGMGILFGGMAFITFLYAAFSTILHAL